MNESHETHVYVIRALLCDHIEIKWKRRQDPSEVGSIPGCPREILPFEGLQAAVEHHETSESTEGDIERREVCE